MKNPLLKRIIRELKRNWSKYLVIFIFIVYTVGFISGYQITDNNLVTAHNESFEKYHTEDGHFIVGTEIDDDILKSVEAEQDIRVFKDYYYNLETDINGDGSVDATIRCFLDENRNDINNICLIDGALPKTGDEIAIDQLFAKTNKIKLGDSITAGGKKLKVSGFISLPDYSSMFEEADDIMYDNKKFGTAIASNELYYSYDERLLVYSYDWLYNQAVSSEDEEQDRSSEIVASLNKKVTILNFIPQYRNQAIKLTGTDIGKDRRMMLIILYMVIIILAFIFLIFINHTIGTESSVIGTLIASGYKVRELMLMYVFPPSIITFLGAVVGNILGYTVFKDSVLRNYMNNHSMPECKTIWNWEAFISTSVVPVIMVLVISIITLLIKLNKPCLAFMRKDFGSNRLLRVKKLPGFSFMGRFRLRIILQNIPNYITLFIGIVFANILLLFGMMMTPMLDSYKEEIIDNMISEYQYTLKMPVETSNSSAEKYMITSLKYIHDSKSEGENINVYGIDADSKYLDLDFSGGRIYVTDSFKEKYGIETGDTLKLKELYGDGVYDLKISDMNHYPAALAVFMSKETFAGLFGVSEDYYNGYFSNEKLDDIDAAYVVSITDREDMVKVSKGLSDSMGDTFSKMRLFAIALSVILVFLLTKMILEKNIRAISLTKVLGYHDGEIARLYIMATTIVVVISVIVGVLVAKAVTSSLFVYFMSGYSGWITLYYAPKVFVWTIIIGLIAYAVTGILQFIKIINIPLDYSLRNRE